MQIKSTVIAGAALALAVVIDLLIYGAGGAGLNVLLVQLAFLAAAGAIGAYTETKVSVRTAVIAAFSVAFAASPAIWTATIPMVMTGIALFVANVLLVASVMGNRLRFHHPVSIVASLGKYLEQVFYSLELLGHLKLPRFGVHKHRRLLQAVAISAPIVLVFAALFIGSDALLSTAIDNFSLNVNGDIAAKIVEQVVLIAVFALLGVGILGGMFYKQHAIEEATPGAASFKYESGVILLLVNVLFAAFIAFQGFYLFAGQQAWDRIEGITYAEYAKAGFSELSIVAVLVVLLITSLRYLHRESKDWRLRLLETTLPLMTLLVLASAWIRLDVYVGEYGYTVLRLFGFWYILTAGVILALFALTNVLQRPQWQFIQQALVAAGIAVFAFTAVSPEALAINLQVKRATAEDPIESWDYVRGMTAEGYVALKYHKSTHPELIAEPTPDPEIAHLADPYFWTYDWPKSRQLEDASWRSWNIARSKIEPVK